MTLVAAYRTFGVPVLVGDFLITAGRKRVGLKKKIHRLQPNLAVGWTGSEIAASSVFTYLHERYREEAPTKRTLEQCLRSFPVADLGAFSVELIGWIYEAQPYCFRWRSNWSHEVFYDQYQLAGSGEALIGRMIGDGTAQSRVPDPIRHDVQSHAIKETLWDVSRLMADEVGARQNQAAGFGHAYEVLMLIGGEFRYVEHALFVFAEIGFDGEDRCIARTLYPVMYRSHHVLDYAVVQVSRLEESHAKHELHVIGPVYRVPDGEPDAIMNDVISRPDAVSFDAQYSCLFASLVKNADSATPETIRPVSLVSSSADQDRAVVIDWEPALKNPWVGTLTVGLPMGFIVAAYRAQISGQI